MQFICTIAVSIAIATILLFYFPQAYGVFHREDFIITNMGLKNGNPFMTVEGEAVRSFSVDGGDETFYAYTFVTDKGIFASTVALGEDDNSPYYSVDKYQLEKFEVGACLGEGTATGEPRFAGKTVEYIPKQIVFENVTKAYTLQVNSDDPDDECETGQHIYKIFSSK